MEECLVEDEDDHKITRSSGFGKLEKDYVLSRYYLETEEAYSNFERENNACLVIQHSFRAYKQRKEFWRKNLAALTIQRVYRGYKYGRKIYREMKKQKQFEERIDYYNVCASKIQSVFRGYICRKNSLDFWKRQSELQEISKKNVEVSNYVTRKLQEEEIDAEIKKTRKQTENFEKLAPSLHHLVSTAAIPGVYQAHKMDPTETLFHSTLEDALKGSTMSFFSTNLPHRKTRKRLTLKENKDRKRRNVRKEKLQSRLTNNKKKNSKTLPAPRIKANPRMRF